MNRKLDHCAHMLTYWMEVSLKVRSGKTHTIHSYWTFYAIMSGLLPYPTDEDLERMDD